eukprot:CAMPEP_0114499556 /NCGR_PEP_ID=MMETSP0109-20121206/7484_1 /TAXON_ID=29199 /ORGANISM="Chlorarachnion reptans, Strain CCCM449" /LENGTH=255 /DNA_ID=CAMNT_0001677139 /DNA_START=135 /DNA_END=899 /DNA_ORIENTATION=+
MDALRRRTNRLIRECPGHDSPVLFSNLPKCANTRIQTDGEDLTVLAHTAWPKNHSNKGERIPVLVLIHEFFGLNPSIVEKADALADELRCVVVAPDTFRGVSTTFIPKAIWLALMTPQARVNKDLNTVVKWIHSQPGVDTERLAVMGFCYGGGKAIRYTTECRPGAATVIFYGSPVTDHEVLNKLQAPVCAIYGQDDLQFPQSLLREFKQGLEDSRVEHEITVYEGVGHAFWTDMEQIRRHHKPQREAWQQCTDF